MGDVGLILGPSWGHCGAIVGPFWGPLGPFLGQAVPFWGQLEAKSRRKEGVPGIVAPFWHKNAPRKALFDPQDGPNIGPKDAQEAPKGTGRGRKSTKRQKTQNLHGASAGAPVLRVRGPPKGPKSVQLGPRKAPKSIKRRKRKSIEKGCKLRGVQERVRRGKMGR